jgi:hypothetical protein
VKPFDRSTCDDPDWMIRHLRGKVSDRKIRLFAIACTRRVWHLLEDERSRRAVEIAELFADGEVGVGEYRDAVREAYAASVEFRSRAYPPRSPDFPHRRAELDSARVAASHAASAAAGAPRRPGVWDLDMPPYRMARDVAHRASQAILSDIRASREEYVSRAARERALQVVWLRDIIGDPARPVTLDPACLTPTVVRLAEAAYAGKDFVGLMPVLGDALEEAGVVDAEVLAHCRSGAEHVRGCHILDLILGRA